MVRSRFPGLKPRALYLRRFAAEVLLFSPEHELMDIVRPRLEAAGADLSRVHAVHGVRRQEPHFDQNSYSMFQLIENIWLLEQEIETREAAGSPLHLIVIDPFPLELFDEQKGEPKLTSTIQRLAEIVAGTEIAILLMVNCPTKPPLHMSQQLRTLESTVQSTWWIGRDHARPQRRLLLPLKMNLIEKPPGRAFSLRDGRVQWDPAPVWTTADQFQADTLERSRKPLFEQEWSELARATYWLREYMQTEERPFQAIKESAAVHGIEVRTLRRAFCGLKGLSWRMPGTNAWAWKLRECHEVEPRFPPGIEAFLYDGRGVEGEEALRSGGVREVGSGRIRGTDL